MTTTHHQPRRLAGGELQPTIELAASIEAACAAYPSALRAPLARLCERHGLDVLGDLDALLATVAVYGFAEGER